MERRIQDYIPYYIGQDVLIYHSDSEPISATLEGYDGASEMVICERVRYKPEQIKLQLRPLSDMTRDEVNDCDIIRCVNFSENQKDNQVQSDAAITSFLIRQGFDVFSLIESGLALNKTTTLPTHDRDKLMEELRKSEIY